MPTILWWGRSDPEYSRNRIILNLLSGLGWSTHIFHPLISGLGVMEAYFRRLKRPDVIWVPCFRHRDIASASYWASRWQVPLIIDPLISAYEKEVFERNKYDPGSLKGRKRRYREADLFSRADIVVADTPAHAEYFNTELNVPLDNLMTLYVGAETDLFKPVDVPHLKKPYQILFYGSFLRLQGAETIVAAAKQTRDLGITWTLLGEGDLKSDCMQMADGYDHIRFEPWMDYQKLPDRISQAHVLLGIFGTSLKADLVIPNKIFQAMAVGRAVITRRSKAYVDTLNESETIGWVPAGDPSALAFLVRKWFEDPSHLMGRGRQTRRLFDTFFGGPILQAALDKVLDAALHKQSGLKDK